MDESALRQSLRKIIDIDNEVYSTRMAFIFCLGLSAFLWWIPVVGPAITGYICGRKTGSMMKGFMCSLMAGVVLLLMVKGMSALLLVHGGYPNVSADEAAKAFVGVTGSVADYLKTFFTPGTPYLNYMGLGVSTLFGGIGGILSRQMRKETAYLISLGATEGAFRPAARSMLLYSANKEMGFKSFDDCIELQKMSTNENNLNEKQKNRKPESARAPEGKPVATTVQTVTTTVSGSTVATQGKEQSKAQGSPFVDILERIERKKDN